jgi:hypothetical protein
MESGLIEARQWIIHGFAYPEIADHLPRWANGEETYRKRLVEWYNK